MDINISKSDVVWSYIAQFFRIGTGVLTLPLILHMLSTEEIAMNYLMMTIGTMVAMIDFGFAPQFGRNITYVFSGAQQLEKEGLNTDVGNSINYHLLQCLIEVAKKVYGCMSIIVLILLLTGKRSSKGDDCIKVNLSFVVIFSYTGRSRFNGVMHC